MPNNEMGTVTNDIMFYCLLASPLSTLVVGQAYDIVGRRPTLFISSIIVASLICLLPYSTVVYPWFALNRIGITLA